MGAVLWQFHTLKGDQLTFVILDEGHGFLQRGGLVPLPTIKRYVKRAINRIKVFCNREDFPEPLEDVAAQIVEDMLKADQVAPTENDVSSITRATLRTTFSRFSVIIAVPPYAPALGCLMFTRMVFILLSSDGTTENQVKGGFTPADDAQDINWIICPRSAPIAVSRTDKVRIFDPETYQKKRARSLAAARAARVL